MNCWLRLRRHSFGPEHLNEIGWHRIKVCETCGHTRRTAHVGCPEGCWGGIDA